MRYAVLTLSFATLLAPTSALAVKVAPQVVFIGDGSRGTELILLNDGNAAASVEVEVLYGYEVTNDDGKVDTVYPTSGPQMKRSAADWIRAYPKRLRVTPGQQQVIRLFSRPRGKVADGEYWARVAIISQPEAGPPKKAVDGQLSMEVGITTRQIVPVFVRRGRVRATPSISQVRSSWTDADGKKALEILYFANAKGGGAFLGRVRGALSSGGRSVGEATKTLAVFEPGWRKMIIPVAAMPAGPLELRIETLHEHPAIEAKDLLPGDAAVWEDAVSGP
jgi:P pilus assembly chaperone PapD